MGLKLLKSWVRSDTNPSLVVLATISVTIFSHVNPCFRHKGANYTYSHWNGKKNGQGTLEATLKTPCTQFTSTKKSVYWWVTNWPQESLFISSLLCLNHLFMWILFDKREPSHVAFTNALSSFNIFSLLHLFRRKIWISSYNLKCSWCTAVKIWIICLQLCRKLVE